MDIEMADTTPEGWRLWLDCPLKTKGKSVALGADRGAYMGYIRLIGRRQDQAKLPDFIVSLPAQYKKAFATARGVVVSQEYWQSSNRALEGPESEDLSLPPWPPAGRHSPRED